ncbi:conserved hypothetical protein [Pseudomonas veronii]|uniref:hypothetical protein n=1 Tax=Pseudomonas veronii TaxID=76761 RepID=UPI001771C211|nr:hypothetical protein [Pseudomonas veronii]CAD0264172.1 conserved hypothetical protein [Pseudomonas veronii]
MPSVQFLSRMDVQRYKPRAPAHLLSISDGDDDQAIVDASRWQSVEYHHFVDGDFDEEKIAMFGASFEHLFRDYFLNLQADRLRESIDRLAATGVDIVVNCQAGRSRSAAVAQFISERHRYSLCQEAPGANQTVLRMLRRDPALLAAYRKTLSPTAAITGAKVGPIKTLLGYFGRWRRRQS